MPQVYQETVTVRGRVTEVDSERRRFHVATYHRWFYLPRESIRRLPKSGSFVTMEVSGGGYTVHRLRTERVR